MKRTLIRTFALVLVAALLGCSATAPKEGKSVEQILAEKDLKIVEELDRLVNFNIRGWQYVNDTNVILEEGASKRYLVELNMPCNNLQWARRVAFTSTMGRTIYKSDRILVGDGSGHVDRCLMKAFYRLEKVKK